MPRVRIANHRIPRCVDHRRTSTRRIVDGNAKTRQPQQTPTRLREFAAACEEFDGLPALREIALAERHLDTQSDLEPFPLFAAFTEV